MFAASPAMPAPGRSRSAAPGGFARRRSGRGADLRRQVGVLFFWVLLMGLAAVGLAETASAALAHLEIAETEQTRLSWMAATLALAAWPAKELAEMLMMLVMGLARIALTVAAALALLWGGAQMMGEDSVLGETFARLLEALPV